jgi:thiol-disulfide isomerase/thioredoxin
MRPVKRNQWVIVVVIAAFALMVWSGYANYKRRKQYAQRQAQGTLVPETANNQSVQQDVADDEGLPDLRGKHAPDFSLRTVEGKKVALADYKGKAVLINFWATWCAPCKIEMPWLIALRSQYAPQGFEILGVNADEPGTPRTKLVKFGQEEGLNYPLLVGDDAMERKYGGIEFLPTSFFVGRDGKVVAETAGLVSKDDVEASIKKALAAGAN